MNGFPSLAERKPGLRPTGFNVLVAPEVVEEKTTGGIFLPQDSQRKEQLLKTRGRLVSVSPVAFDNASYPDGTTPKAGDAIIFAKIAGLAVEGADGRDYRIISDKDVAAVIEEPPVIPTMLWDTDKRCIVEENA